MSGETGAGPVTLCIGALTLIPLNTPEDVPGSDKIHHLLAFGALTFPSAAFYPKALLRVVFVAAFYGGLIEIIQPYVGRSGELADFIADLAGIGLGASIGLLLHAAYKRRLSKRARHGAWPLDEWQN